MRGLPRGRAGGITTGKGGWTIARRLSAVKRGPTAVWRGLGIFPAETLFRNVWGEQSNICAADLNEKKDCCSVGKAET